MSTQDERKTAKSGRPIDPVSGLEVYPDYANYVPEGGIKPGSTRPAHVPEYANYWPDDQPQQVVAVVDGEEAQSGDQAPAGGDEVTCPCGKKFETAAKFRGHRLHCKKE